MMQRLGHSLVLAISAFVFGLPVRAESPSLTALQDAIVAITAGGTDAANIVGTGFLVSSDGLVITADHVVPADAKKVVILRREEGGRRFRSHEATVIARYGRDPREPRDIALLRISQPPLTGSVEYFRIGSTVSIGDEVLIGGMGRPPAIELAVRPLMRKGIVASVEYRLDNVPVLILDFEILPGYSGAPVLTLPHYEVVGVVRGRMLKNTTDVGFTIAHRLQPSDLEVRPPNKK